jgi:hypothetical protein
MLPRTYSHADGFAAYLGGAEPEPCLRGALLREQTVCTSEEGRLAVRAELTLGTCAQENVRMDMPG